MLLVFMENKYLKDEKTLLITGGTGHFVKKCAEILFKKYKLNPYSLSMLRMPNTRNHISKKECMLRGINTC